MAHERTDSFMRALGTSPSGNGKQFDGMPWWVRATVVLGFPTVVATFLIYFIAMSLTAKMDEHSKETRDKADHTMQLLRQICANTATTDAQRNACFPQR